MMLKHSLAALAFVAVLVFADGPAFGAAGITVDGDKSDWDALGLVHTDNITPGSGYLQISAYGATVIGETFYSMLETTQPVSSFAHFYPGAWINADQSTGTALKNVPSTAAGTDIEIERDSDDPVAPPGLNYWGKDDDVTKFLSAVSGGAYAESGYVWEWSAPVSGIQTTLAGLPDNVPSGFPWSVCIGGEGSPGSGGWGRSIGGPITVVPEPCTLALLACGLLGMLCYAWRKRK